MGKYATPDGKLNKVVISAIIKVLNKLNMIKITHLDQKQKKIT